jgi:hypothetical protein
MLVTDTSWVESHPVRRAIVESYQAWRCVAWTDDVPNFLVFISRDHEDNADLPDGCVVAGPEALLDATSLLESGTFSVYVLDRAKGYIGATLSLVTGIWRERDSLGELVWFWYGTEAGELKPCSRAQGNLETRPELVSVLMFDPRVAAASPNL